MLLFSNDSVRGNELINKCTCRKEAEITMKNAGTWIVPNADFLYKTNA